MTSTQPTAPAQGGLTDTPRTVFLALIEEYRQAKQDYIYGLYGEGWPVLQDIEKRLLSQLHATCDGWLARYDAAAARQAT